VPRREAALTAARIEPVEGEAIAVLRTFARHPVMAAARAPRAAFVTLGSPLTAHDRETLILRIGWDCRSEYEWAKHVGSVGRAREHGVDPALVAAGPTASGVSEDDALLMRVADDLHQDAMVSDRTWSAILERYDLAAAMSAVFTASSYRSTSMSLNTYGVQLESGDEGFPTGPVD
jgi:alkylhydroperoxidase family enzyme